MLTAQGRNSAAVLASGALHLLLSLGPEQRVVRVAVPNIVSRVTASHSMEFEVVAGLSAGKRAAGPEQVTLETPPMPHSLRRAPVRESAQAVAQTQPIAQAAPTHRAETASAPLAAASPASAAAPHAIDLSPLAAARTLGTDGPASWALQVRSERERAGLDHAAEARLARAIPELIRNQDEGVEQLAQDGSQALAKPWDFIRQPLRGARYHYRGVGFDAIIRADGSLQYRSKDGLQFMFGQTVARYDQPPASTFGVGFRDAPFSKLFGRDAHAGERRKLLESTRALRELLHERALRLALERAATHLTQKLAAVSRQLEVGAERAAHAQLFALWDECAEDEVGAPARSRIELFIREHCAQGSAQTFAAPELLVMNQKRASRQRFEPYALLSDAGVLPIGTRDAGGLLDCTSDSAN